jgi:hypothetical protein
VRALQIALSRVFPENWNYKPTGEFDIWTKMAVIVFQEQYLKLNKGTGFVGPLTRAKLNELFKCENK